MTFNISNFSKKLFPKGKRPKLLRKLQKRLRKKPPTTFDFRKTKDILKNDGFEYKETQQRLSDISKDTKRFAPLLKIIPQEFTKEIGKDIPEYPSQEEVIALSKIILKNLDKTYGPFNDDFVVAENKKDEGKKLTEAEDKLIHDRHPPHYPLKDIPKTQFACFEASVLTNYIIRKLTKLQPEILLFEGQVKSDGESERTEHALAFVPEYNLLLETTDTDTEPAIQKHDFKSELKKTGKTTLTFNDTVYKIPPDPYSIKERFKILYDNMMAKLHRPERNKSDHSKKSFTNTLHDLVKKIMG